MNLATSKVRVVGRSVIIAVFLQQRRGDFLANPAASFTGRGASLLALTWTLTLTLTLQPSPLPLRLLCCPCPCPCPCLGPCLQGVPVPVPCPDLHLVHQEILLHPLASLPLSHHGLDGVEGLVAALYGRSVLHPPQRGYPCWPRQGTTITITIIIAIAIAVAASGGGGGLRVPGDRAG